MPFLYPQLAFLLGIAVFATLGFLVKPRWWRLPELSPNERPFFFTLMLFVFGFWAAFLCFNMALVRYTVIVHFPMALYVAWLFLKRPKISMAIAAALLVFGLFNQHGAWMKTLPPVKARSGDLLERSRELLRDLDNNVNLCRRLEKDFFEAPIVVKQPHSQMLTIPEFGYVKKPLPHIIDAGLVPTFAPVIPLKNYLREKSPTETLCLYSANINESRWGVSLKPVNTEPILFEDYGFKVSQKVFRRTWAPANRATVRGSQK